MMNQTGQRWLVIGAGLSGRASAGWLAARGAEVCLWDDDPAARAAAADALGSAVTVPAVAPQATDQDAVLVSPGVAPDHALVVAAGARVRGDLDLWQAERRVCTLAVTGTNGKSTVTRLLAEMLRHEGLDVAEGANLGTPVTELLTRSCDRAVLEVSSFQLHYARTFLPEIAVLTNLAPDHLDWHPEFSHYAAAKRNLFERLDGERAAVLPAEPQFAGWVAPGVSVVRFGTTPGADVRVAGPRIQGRVGRVDIDLAVPPAFAPPHQSLNLAAAAAAAVLAGVSPAAMAAAAARFEMLPYRMQAEGPHHGLRFVNDSKATNLHAMVAAVQSFEPGSVLLLAGGKRKGLDWKAVTDEVAARVASVAAYGECADEIMGAWSGAMPVTVHPDLDTAFAAATGRAAPGHVVLLAPGTSSFDAFRSYAERGARFDQLVTDFAAAAGGRATS